MRRIRALVLPVGIGVLVGVSLTALGMQAEFAWGWGVLGTVIVVAVGMVVPDDPRADAPGRVAAPRYVGSDVSRLAWAINTRTDTVNETLTRRVRATLRRRLLRHGVDVEDERQAAAAERLLGDGLWARLTGRSTGIEDLRAAIAAAERLASTPTRESKKETE